MNLRTTGLANGNTPDNGETGPAPGDADDYRDAIPPSHLGVKAIALMDVQLRTALSAMIVSAAVPGTLTKAGSSSELRQAIEFYARLSRDRDPAHIFPAPPPVEVRARNLGRLLWAPAVDRVEILRFESPYQVRYQPMRPRFDSHKRNRTARAMHWRHKDRPRPTIIVVHGFSGSPYWFNSNFFQLPWFYRHGCDVVLATLPFHGARNDRFAPFSGSGLFDSGIGIFTEAMLQSVCDLRVLVDYLKSLGVDHVGITGVSLGGYLTALMAAAEPRLHVAIPNSAVTEMSSLIDSWFPMGPVLKAGMRLGHIDADLNRAALSLHSPLSYPSRLARDRLFIIGGLADRLAPPEQSARLWLHWGKPRLHWFPGSHIIHVRRANYLREVGRFLRETDFSEG